MALPRGQYPNNGRFGHGRAKPTQRFDPLVTTSTLADATPSSPIGGKVSTSYLWYDTIPVSISPTSNGGTVVSYDVSDPPEPYSTVLAGTASKTTYTSYNVGQGYTPGVGYEIDQAFIEFDVSSIFGPTSLSTTSINTQYDTVTLDFFIPAFSDNTTTDFTVQIYGDSVNATNLWAPPLTTSLYQSQSTLSFYASINAAIATFNTTSISAGSTVSVVIPKSSLTTTGGRTRFLVVSSKNTTGTEPTTNEYFQFQPKLTFNKFLSPTATVFINLNSTNSGYLSTTSVSDFTTAFHRSGGLSRSVSLGTPFRVGSSLTNNQAYASYLEFNTSNYIGSVSLAGLGLTINTDTSTTDFGIEVYKVDYGTLAANDWLNPSSLTMVGNINTSEVAGQTTITIPIDPSSISLTSPTRFVLYSSFIRDGIGSISNESFVDFSAASLAVTLVTPIIGGPASSTLGAATGSASATPVITASGSPSLAGATGSASASPVITGYGISTLGDATGTATGSSVIQLSGSTALSDSTATATGTPIAVISGTSFLSDATGAATGAPVATGSGAASLGDAIGDGVGSSVFSPSQLAPILWLDASDTATITQSANSVSSWLDKSTNAWTFTQTTASAKPTTNTRTINGKNVLDFDGTDVLLGSGTTTNWKFLHDGTLYLIAAVVVVDSPIPGVRPILATGTTTNANSGQLYVSTGGFATHLVRNATSNIINNPTADIGYRTDKTLILGVKADPSNATPSSRSAVYVDNYSGQSAGTIGGSVSTANATFALRIGGYGTTSGTFNGAIAEIVILTGANATEANWFVLRDYLSAKWGGSTVIDTSADTLGYGTAGHYSDLFFTAVPSTVTSSYTATAVTGDITITGVSPTVEQSAVLSGSPSLANATGAAAGTPTVTGTGAVTLANATSSVVGSPIAVASGTPVLAAATGAATGQVVASGSAASTLANATSSAAGTTIAIGSAAPTLGAATSSAAGTTTILSSGSPTLGAASASGVAAAIGVITASGAVTLQNATALGFQSTPQTITTGVGTIPMTGLDGTSNIATFVFSGGVQTTRGVITFTAVSGKTQQGVITLSGSHNAPQPGPTEVVAATSSLNITGASNTPTEGFLAQTGVFFITGPGRLPVITKHLAVWDGTQWRIARFKEWTGSGWVESDRVKANGVSGPTWEKVY